jgi:hypothetical protein
MLCLVCLYTFAALAPLASKLAFFQKGIMIHFFEQQAQCSALGVAPPARSLYRAWSPFEGPYYRGQSL